MSPYLRLMRFDKPTGTWLLFWPCAWAITIASPGQVPDIYMLFLFMLGAFLLRSAGCVINDILDRDIDKKVERTKLRPIAAGEIDVAHALALFIFLMFVGFLILVQLNKLSIMLGFAVVIPIVLYPLAKRYFVWPQLILALVFNWGMIMAFAAIEDTLSLNAFILYLACVFWTLGYDTIYAHQDKKYDKAIGLKSTAFSFIGQSKNSISLIFIPMLICLAVIGIINEFGLFYYFGLAVCAVYLFFKLYRLNINEPGACAANFKSHTIFGFLYFIVLVVERMQLL